MSESSYTPPRRRSWFRRIVLLVLAMALLAAGYLAGRGRLPWRGPRHDVAAYLNISQTPPSVLAKTPFDSREFEIFKRTQAAMVVNPYVLNVALRDLAVANMPMIKAI